MKFMLFNKDFGVIDFLINSVFSSCLVHLPRMLHCVLDFPPLEFCVSSNECVLFFTYLLQLNHLKAIVLKLLDSST